GVRTAAEAVAVVAGRAGQTVAAGGAGVFVVRSAQRGEARVLIVAVRIRTRSAERSVRDDDVARASRRATRAELGHVAVGRLRGTARRAGPRRQTARDGTP